MEAIITWHQGSSYFMIDHVHLWLHPRSRLVLPVHALPVPNLSCTHTCVLTVAPNMTPSVFKVAAIEVMLRSFDRMSDFAGDQGTGHKQVPYRRLREMCTTITSIEQVCARRSNLHTLLPILQLQGHPVRLRCSHCHQTHRRSVLDVPLPAPHRSSHWHLPRTCFEDHSTMVLQAQLRPLERRLSLCRLQ